MQHKHVILFTGHMVDAVSREKSRFPPSQESHVRSAIEKLIIEEFTLTDKKLFGIAGGASGGDIIFHEVCVQLNIDSELYLGLPAEEFKAESVSFAGPDWESRFDYLLNNLPVRYLSDEKTGIDMNHIWVATNEWMLESALEIGHGSLTLIALWDGKGGDGPGGTKDMITRVEEKGGRVKII